MDKDCVTCLYLQVLLFDVAVSDDTGLQKKKVLTVLCCSCDEMNAYVSERNE